MKSPIRLHIANIDLCDIITESIVGIIEVLMDNLDEVSKYKVATNIICELDNLSQTCYDEASADAQLVIETFEDTNWNYGTLPSYTEYEDFIDKFLSVGEFKVGSEHSIRNAVNDVHDDFLDVEDEFGIKPSHYGRQLHFPNDYANEEALAQGRPSTPPVNTQADEKKKARAEFLANVKAQQNTSQSK